MLIDRLVHEAAERAAAGAALLVQDLDGNEAVTSATKSVLRSLALDTAEVAQMLAIIERVSA